MEQIAELHRAGTEVIFVSSGAVGMGKKMLRTQNQLNMSFMDLQKGDSDHGLNGSALSSGHRNLSFASFINKDEAPRAKYGEKKKIYDSACAAAGQVC